MIGNVNLSSSALTSMYQTSNAQQANTGANSAKLLSNLTPQDWAVGDAIAGKTLDHGTPEAEPALPISVWNIALDRQNGTLPAGQPVTVAYLKNMEKGETNQGMIDGINRGIAHLEATMGASSTNSARQTGLDVFA